MKIANLAKDVFEFAKNNWETKPNSQCLIESTDIFEVLSNNGIACSEKNEQIMEKALMDQGFYKEATEFHKTLH